MSNNFQIPDGFKLTSSDAVEQLKNTDFLKLKDLIPPPQTNIPKPDIPVMKNQMVEEQKKTNELVNQLQSQLTSIQYENMKLNAQIEVLNHTIDSNNEKIDELRTANSKLEVINQTLEKNNKHYWLFTFIITFVVAFIFYLLGFITPV